LRRVRNGEFLELAWLRKAAQICDRNRAPQTAAAALGMRHLSCYRE
jgi:hypothetical protein